MVQVGAIYRHYKKKTDYLVLALARHSETLEPLVVYVALYSNDASQVWARPLKMWEEQVEDADGNKMPRFSLVSPTSISGDTQE
ncbi:MAG: DUF1653 domain-containing protein [Candidatus Saccharimonadales bacterium]